MNGVRKAFSIGFVAASAIAALACESAPTESPPIAQIQSELAALPEETPVTAAVAEAGPTCDAVCNAKTWMTESRHAEAREALERHLVRTPADIEAALLLTQNDIADEEFATAYQRADAWLSEQHDVRMSEKRAVASLLSDDPETAAIDYRELISDLRDEPEGARVCDELTGRCVAPIQREAVAWVGLATAEYNRKNLDGAQAIADDVLNQGRLEGTLDPACGQFIGALVSSQRGDDESALAQYEAILASHPRDPATLNNIGGIHYRRGDLVTARRYHTASYEATDGGDRRSAAIAWSNVGELDLLEGKMQDAEDKMLESIEISKGFAGGHFNLAVLYDLQGETEKSIRHMRTALALDEQGVTRWNTSWFSPAWKTHFDALVATAEGRDREAAALFASLVESDVAVLAQTAERHTGADRTVYYR